MLRSTLGRMSMSPSKSSPNLAASTPSTPARSDALKTQQQQQEAEPSATFILELADGTVKQKVSFPGPCITLGRDPKTHLRLVKSTISRVHARVLLPSPGSGQPMTLNVTGGTGLTLNGAHLGRGAVSPLHATDRIAIDRWFFRVELDAAPPMPELMTPARGTAAPTPRRRTRMSLMDAEQIETPRRRGARRSSTTLYRDQEQQCERDVILIEEIDEEPENQEQQPDAENVEPAAPAASPTKGSPRKRERRRSSFFGYAAADPAEASRDPASSSAVVESTLSLYEAAPRLPRSISSPSRLCSPIKNRKVSLRTKTLLRGCEEFIERERRAEITQSRRSQLGASEPVGAAEAGAEVEEAAFEVAQDQEDVEMSDAEAEDAAAAEEEQQQLLLQEGMTRSSSGSVEFDQDADADEVDRSLSLLEDVDESDDEVESNNQQATPSRNDLGAFLTPQVQRHASRSRISLPGTVVRSGTTPERSSWTAYLPAAVVELEQEGDRSVEEVMREILEDEQGLDTDREDDEAEEEYEEEELPASSSDEAVAPEAALHEPAVAALAHLLDAANVQGAETPAREALRSLVSSPTKASATPTPSTPRYGGLYAAISASPAARLLGGAAPKTPDMRGFARLFARAPTAQPTPDAAFLKHVFALLPSEQEDVSIRDLRALFKTHEAELAGDGALDESAVGEDLKALLATPHGYNAVLRAAESVVRPAALPQLEEPAETHEPDESLEEEPQDIPVRRGSPSKRVRAQRQSLIPGPFEQAALPQPEAEEEVPDIEEEQEASQPVEKELAAVAPEEALELSSAVEEQTDEDAAAALVEELPTKVETKVEEAPQVAPIDAASAHEQASVIPAAVSTPARVLTPRSSVRRPRLTASSTAATPAPATATAVASTPASTRTRRVAPATASKTRQAQAEVAQTPKATAEKSQSQTQTPATTRRTRTKTAEAEPMPAAAAEEAKAKAVPSSEANLPAKRSRARVPASARKTDAVSSTPAPSSDAVPSSDALELEGEPEKAKRSTRKAASAAKSRLRKPAAGPSSAAADEESAGEGVASPMPKSRARRAVREEEEAQPQEPEPVESQPAEEEEAAKSAPKPRATRAKALAASASKLPTRSRRGAAAVAESSEVDEAAPTSQATEASEEAAPAKRTRAKAAPKSTRSKAPSSSAAEAPSSSLRISLSELPSEANVPSSDVEVPSSSVADEAAPTKTRGSKAKAAPASGIATAKPTRKAASAKAPSSDVAEAPVRATRSRAAKR